MGIDYTYSLIRWVSNLDRMEPVNVGLLLQGPHGLRVKFSPHAAKSEDVDTGTFNQWKSLFLEEAELHGDSLLRPSRRSPEIFLYLSSLCRENIQMTRPLSLTTDFERTTDEVFNDLMQRLVLPLGKDGTPTPRRPTGLFRLLAEEKGFLKRGMKKHAHVEADGSSAELWRPYRQVLNGEFIAVDKVEVDRQMGSTTNEIERLPWISQKLPRLLGTTVHGKRTRYVLLADKLDRPFAGQDQEDFRMLKESFEARLAAMARAGATVIRDESHTVEFVQELDEKLPK